MSNVLKYLVVYPLLFIIGLIDSCLNCCKSRDARYKELPKASKQRPFSMQKEKTAKYASYVSENFRKVPEISPNTNLYLQFTEAVRAHQNKPTMGVRRIIKLEDQPQPNGKVFKKYNLDDTYRWMTYQESQVKIDALANGMLKIGIKSNDYVILFAETRREWLMSALACFKIKAVVVTLYATLGKTKFCLKFKFFIQIIILRY